MDEQAPRTGRFFRLLGQAALLVACWVAIFEIGLRAQQYYGPLYDLELANVDLSWESDVLNHVPAPKNQHLCIYGDLTGTTYQRAFDSNGIRIIDDSALLAGCKRSASVLFMGDSFMEGYDDKNTLPYHVAKYFREERSICLKTHNAGYTSYSPSIFIPQAKKLLPIVRPDYVVIDIDETDFYDDFVRYRKLVTRNERGENVGVKVSPIGHACSVGLMQTRQHALYLTRLVSKLWLSYVSIPAVIEANRSRDLEIFSWSGDHSPDIDRKYSEARAVFRPQPRRAHRRIAGLRPGRHARAVVFHPHLNHLKADASGQVWNGLVSSMVRDACTAKNFQFFNATDTMKQRVGTIRKSSTGGSTDMHFSFDGLEAYSNAVAGFMAKNMIKPEDWKE